MTEVIIGDSVTFYNQQCMKIFVPIVYTYYNINLYSHQSRMHVFQMAGLSISILSVCKQPRQLMRLAWGLTA